MEDMTKTFWCVFRLTVYMSLFMRLGVLLPCILCLHVSHFWISFSSFIHFLYLVTYHVS